MSSVTLDFFTIRRKIFPCRRKKATAKGGCWLSWRLVYCAVSGIGITSAGAIAAFERETSMKFMDCLSASIEMAIRTVVRYSRVFLSSIGTRTENETRAFGPSYDIPSTPETKNMGGPDMRTPCCFVNENLGKNVVKSGLQDAINPYMEKRSLGESATNPYLGEPGFNMTNPYLGHNGGPKCMRCLCLMGKQPGLFVLRQAERLVPSETGGIKPTGMLLTVHVHTCPHCGSVQLINET